MSSSKYAPLADILYEGLRAQAEVSHYGEGTHEITGPVDLLELAEHVDTELARIILKGFEEDANHQG